MNTINNFIFESEKDEKNKAFTGVLIYLLSIVNEYMQTHEDSSEIESFLKEKNYLEDLKETNFSDKEKDISEDDIIKSVKNMLDKLYKEDTDKVNESISSNEILLEKDEEDKQKAIETLVNASENVSANDFHSTLQKEREKMKQNEKETSKKAGRKFVSTMTLWGAGLGAMKAVFGLNAAASTGALSTVLAGTSFGTAAGGTAIAVAGSAGIFALGAAGASAVIAGSGAAVIKVKRKNRDKDLAGLQSMVDNESDPAKKEELQKKLDIFSKAHVTNTGQTRFSPFFGNLNKDEIKEYQSIAKNVKDNKDALRKEGKQYIEKHGDSWKDKIHNITKTNYEEKHPKKNKNTEKEPEEVIVKDRDGSQIHQRAKKVGDGYTYVRTKGGKEVGYASKEDFQKAQQRKAKKQNESLVESINCVSLIDYICS